MKLYFPLFLLVCLCAACTKEQIKTDSPSSDTFPVSKILSSDTLRSGSFWELAIGDSSVIVYRILQKIHAEKKVNYLGITANSFNKLADIATRLPLYTSLDLDETKGTSTGVQIRFIANKISSIHLNNGQKLTKWPTNAAASATVVEQELIENVYQKLVNVNALSAYSNKFERISLFFKNIEKNYDPIQRLSPQWSFSVTSSDKILYYIFLNFSAGILNSIYITKYQL